MLLVAGALCAALAACGAPETPPQGQPTRVAAGHETTWVEIAGERFELELALDPRARQRGLSGHGRISRGGGMLFVDPSARPLAMVMRDCPQPIDVAFLDAAGRVVALHAMVPEPPRRPDESPFEYESRLPTYASGEPALFAIETAGGRMAELSLRVGDRVVLPARELAARAR